MPWSASSLAQMTLEQITILCSPSTSGAMRLTLRTNGLPFMLSGAERSRSRDAGSRPATGLVGLRHVNAFEAHLLVRHDQGIAINDRGRSSDQSHEGRGVIEHGQDNRYESSSSARVCRGYRHKGQPLFVQNS